MAVSKVYGTYYEGLAKRVQDSLARVNEVFLNISMLNNIAVFRILRSNLLVHCFGTD